MRVIFPDREVLEISRLTEREANTLKGYRKGDIIPLGMFTRISTAREFGSTLARARKGLGLTQRELALAIGVGERFIVELERGKSTAQLGKALAAAKAAGMAIADTAETVIEDGPGSPS